MRRTVSLKRMIFLAAAALLLMLILVPTALAQDKDLMQPEENALVVDEDTLQQIAGQPLPETGGLEIGRHVFLPAALLVGSVVLSYAVVVRRRK